MEIPVGLTAGTNSRDSSISRRSVRRENGRSVIGLAVVQSVAPQHTLRVCVERGLCRTRGVPPFCKNASEVVTRALDPDSTSTDLARIVLKDLGLTSLLLRVANSAMYNRSGRPVMSVAHAIILLGWDTVRNLVHTVRYIEYFAKRGAGLRKCCSSR